MFIENEDLKKYARLIAKMGINIRKGEGALINFSTEALPLVRELAKALYDEGAKNVVLQFNDDEITRARYIHGHNEIFDYYPDFEVDFTESAYKDGYHRIAISAPNPELLKGIDRDIQKRANNVALTKRERLYEYMDSGKLKWVVVAFPSVAWANKVFPELPTDQAIEKLWDNIKKVVRLDEEDPVRAWEEHDRSLKVREKWLNDMDFKRIKFQGPGTDITLHLPEGHKWVGGSSETPDGVKYMANMPTEEIFTMPHAKLVNGKVRATKPLSVMGNLIHDFSLVFQNGKVIEVEADENRDVIDSLITMDDGAARLGEVALVCESSPIAESGILFYNTLFDENASCHFALGSSYAETMKNGEKMTEEERGEKGANKSKIHVDFMVGGPDVHVTGFTHDGREIPVLRNGEWVI